MKLDGVYCVVFFAVLFCVENCVTVAITASPIEKVLEKLGSRVGSNEYVTVIKKPLEIGEAKAKTFVLLSKLYMLSGDANGNPTNEIIENGAGNGFVRFPMSQLDFRQPRLPLRAETGTGRIVFPDAPALGTVKTPVAMAPEEKTTTKAPLAADDVKSTESTTFKPRVYNYKPFDPNSQATLRTTTERGETKAPDEMIAFNPGWKQDGMAATSKLIEPIDQTIEPEETITPEKVEFHTLIRIPHGCSPGQRKDHHGKCRTPVNFRPTSAQSRPTYSLPLPLSSSTSTEAPLEKALSSTVN